MAASAVPRCECDPTRLFKDEEAFWLHRSTKHGDEIPAGIRKNVKVPAAALGLPWKSLPRDPAVCDEVIELLDSVAGRARSAEARAYLDAERDILATLAQRLRAAAS